MMVFITPDEESHIQHGPSSLGNVRRLADPSKPQTGPIGQKRQRNIMTRNPSGPHCVVDLSKGPISH